MTDAGVSDEQRAVLDVLVGRVLDGLSPFVNAIDLRKVAPGADRDAKKAFVASLVPELATLSEGGGDQLLTPTLKGLLASNHAGLVAVWIQALLQFLRQKYEDEGAFVRYTWKELKEKLSLGGAHPTDEKLGRAITIIRTAGLENGSCTLATDDRYFWGRPVDIEDLIDIQYPAQLIALRERQAETLQRQAEAAAAASRAANASIVQARGGGPSVLDLLDTVDYVGKQSPELRIVIGADISELERALRTELWKAAMLLCGSVLEAVLLDALCRNTAVASSYNNKRRFPDDWGIADLLDAAAGEGLISATAKQAGIAVKDHRDLIHPQRQVRDGVVVDGDTAGAMTHLLKLVVRDLASSSADGRLDAYTKK